MSKRLPKLIRRVVNVRANQLAQACAHGHYFVIRAELQSIARELTDAGRPLDDVLAEIATANLQFIPTTRAREEDCNCAE